METGPLRAGVALMKNVWASIAELRVIGHQEQYPLQEVVMIALGVILLIVGFLTGVSILWTIGIILLVIGAALWIMGSAGHAVAGRRHYW